MVALSKTTAEIQVARRHVSGLAVVTLFSLFGLVLSIFLARYGIDIASGM
ncbi:hypothetical protein [Bradyrhizobium sp. UFLA03-84]|nr:hypothetical protein [Bradyrhizobium sp. UFLA03-84]